MSDSPPTSGLVSRQELARRAAAIYSGWTEESVKEDQRLGLAPTGAPFTEAQAEVYDEVMQMRAAFASGLWPESLPGLHDVGSFGASAESPGAFPGLSGAFPGLSGAFPGLSGGFPELSGESGASPEKSGAPSNPRPGGAETVAGALRQLLSSAVITRALWHCGEVVPDEQVRRALRTWARSESTMSRRRAGETLGGLLDGLVELAASDRTREIRALRARWVRLGQTMGTAHDPATLDETLESIEALKLPEEIARRLVDSEYWRHAPLPVFAQLVTERTVGRATSAHAFLMGFYVAGLEELREPDPVVFEKRLELVREGFAAIWTEFGSVLGDATRDLLMPRRAPEWILAVVSMFGLLRLTGLPSTFGPPT